MIFLNNSGMSGNVIFNITICFLEIANKLKIDKNLVTIFENYLNKQIALAINT